MALNGSLYFVTQAAAENMKRNGGGSIINIGSMWAHQAVKATRFSAYSMAKAALHAFAQHLATGRIPVRISIPVSAVTCVSCSRPDEDPEV